MPYTLYRNNSKKLRLLRGYHMNIILPRACKKICNNKKFAPWLITTNLPGVLASATGPHGRKQISQCIHTGGVTSGRRSWPQERLLVKLSIEPGRTCDLKTRLAFFVKGFPAYWDHSILNPFVRKSTCFVYLQSSLFVQSSSSRQRRSLESNEDCLAYIYGTYMYTKCVCKVVQVESK